MGCSLTALGSQVEDDGWHRHDMDELCLVTGSSTCIVHAGSDTVAEDGTLYLFRHGEAHGYRNRGRQEPHLWVVHYRPDPALYAEFPALIDRDPRQRVWQLDHERRDAFKTHFLRLLSEQERGRRGAAQASSAWLRLLLISIARWRADAPALAPDLASNDPEILALWQLINDHVGAPRDLAAAIRRQVPNYDSLRHRFRAAFHQSPRALLASLCMQRAKNLLIETDLSIADVSSRLGYARQHEFARAFRREVGCTATWWREHAGNARMA